MVLKRNRPHTDTLIIDASLLFEKVKKNNRLRSSDIRRIADCIRERQEIPHFSTRVCLEQIRENDCNLNIPRYVDSNEAEPSFDIRATMLGGIPKRELDSLGYLFSAMPGIYESLFAEISVEYVALATDEPAAFIAAHPATQEYRQNCRDAFAEDGTEFVFASLREEVAEILDVRNPKPKQIEEYLAKSKEKDSYEYKLVSVLKVMEEEKAEKRKLRQMENALEEKTVSTIENLSEDETRNLLNVKWIQPLMTGLYGAADAVVEELASKVKAVSDKYADTFRSIEDEDKAVSAELLEMVKELTGSEFDNEGLEEIKRILGE